MEQNDWIEVKEELPSPDSIIELGLGFGKEISAHPNKFRAVAGKYPTMYVYSVETERGTTTSLIKARLDNYTHWRYAPDEPSVHDAVAKMRGGK